MKGTYYTVEIRDKKGKLLSREKHKSRSFVQQWNELISTHIRNASLSIKDTGGTDRTITRHANTFLAEAGGGTASYGISVGRGSTPVAISDYALETPCGEGTGANQLDYQAMLSTAPSVSGSDCSFTLTRSAINSSGSTITVTEVGLQVAADDGTTRYFLVIRDVLGSSRDIPDGGWITVVYTIKVTV